MADQKCRGCGCTEANCSGCVAKTGEPCFWVQPDLCSACAPPAELEEAAVEVVSAQLREALKESFIGEENMTPEAKAKMLAVVKERLAEAGGIAWVTSRNYEVTSDGSITVEPVTFEYGGPDAPEFQNQYMQKPIPPRKPG